MGYRLHATIPNVDYEFNYLELGKQYDYKWESFNDKWFGRYHDGGTISKEDFDEFYNELTTINKEPGEFNLYNLELLKEMIEFARKHNYIILFESY